MSVSTQLYELTFILGEKAGQEEGMAKASQLKEFFKSIGGSFTKEEVWGRRDLAYPINRNRTGFYVTLWFNLPTDQLNVLERHLRFDEEIIRSLVTKAYTTAQPGTLSPVVEAEKGEKGLEKPETASAEEMLRRSTTASGSKKFEEEAEEIPEEERLKQLDETLDALMKDEQ